MKKLLLIGLLLSFSLVTQAGQMYVRSANAKLMDADSFKANMLGKIKKGEQVDILEKQKGWYRISHEGKEGWVNKFVLSKESFNLIAKRLDSTFLNSG